MLIPEQFPLIIAAASERGALYFAKALEALQVYEGEGLVQKTELSDLRSTFNGAFEKAWTVHVREPFVYAGKWEKLSDAERRFEQSIGYPQCHTIAGLLKRLPRGPEGEMRDAMFNVVNECALIAPRVVALKDKIGKRAPAMTRTRQAEIDRAAKAMHCQVCGCDVLAETGVIAHHGYQRPGEGWQTASCPGARHLPFEADRERLGQYIEGLKDQKTSAEEFLVRVTEETTSLMWKYDDHSVPRKRWEPQATKMVIVTRATWAELHAEAMAAPGNGLLHNVTFDNLKSAKMGQLRGTIRHLGDSIIAQTKRFEGWKKTHVWVENRWVNIVTHKAQGGTYEQMIEGTTPPIVFVEGHFNPAAFDLPDDDWQFS